MNYVVLPSSNDSDAEFFISKWYVKVGDKDRLGDALVAYEEEKTIVDLYSDYDGVIVEIYVHEEETAAPGTKICAIE